MAEEEVGKPVPAPVGAVEVHSPTPQATDGHRSERRMALVIGNGAYGSGPLANPPSDARAMASTLEELGFEVRLGLDLTNSEMLREVIEFGRSLRDGGVGLFYYAGHAIQLHGKNYLIPIDAEILDEDYVPVETLNLDQVLWRMGGADNRLNVIILDACRNNPFARRFRSVKRGLAPAVAPSGVFIGYATAGRRRTGQ